MRGLTRVVGVGLGAAILFLAVAAGATTTVTQVNTTPPVPHPINLPAGPQQDAGSCPNPPDLSSPLPPGATISAPVLVPPGSASISAAGQTYDLTDTCEYTLNVPVAALSADVSLSPGASPDSISITYVGSGGDIYFPTGVADPISFTYSGHTCSTTAEIVSAFGLAVAEQELDSGSCTSSAHDVGATWGYADAVDTSEQVAPLTQEPTFHTMYQSYESGSIFFGQFQECMENPPGQQSTYVCAYDNYGPLF